MSEKKLKKRLSELIEQDEHLYAVVDAARDKYLALSPRTRFGIRTYSLLEGSMASSLDEVAPHLVPVSLNTKYIDLWEERLGTSAGILLLAAEEPEFLRPHLRYIFEATDEKGGEYFFRYFDPRVLRLYLPTCTGEEVVEFFGPIRKIFVEAERAGRIVSFEARGTGVEVSEVTL